MGSVHFQNAMYQNWILVHEINAMWAIISALPVDMTVNVLEQISVRDLARLDESWPQAQRGELHKTIFSQIAPVDVHFRPHLLNVIYSWMFTRLLRIRTMQIRGDCPLCLQMMRRNVHFIQQLTVYYTGIRDDPLIQELASCENLCTKVKCLSMNDKQGTSCANVLKQIASFPHLLELNVSFNHFADVSATFQILNICSTIRKLFVFRWLEQVLIHIADFVSPSAAGRLTEITAGRIALSRIDLIYVAQHCPNLESFTYYISSDEQESVPAKEDWLTFASSCTQLRSVSASTVTESCPALLGALMKNCPNFQSASICGTVIDDATLSAAPNCSQLTRLRGQWDATNMELVSKAKLFLHRLLDLDVTFSDHATDVIVDTLCFALRCCTNLRTIQLPPHPSKFDRILAAVAAHCHMLRSICIHPGKQLRCQTIDECGAQLTEIAAVNAGTLESFCIHWNCIAVTQLGALLHLLRGAKVVDLTGSELYLDDDMVCTIVKNRPRQCSVKPFSSTVTDRAVLAMANHGKRFPTLDLQACPLVTESALMTLVENIGPYLQLVFPSAMSNSARRRIKAIKQRKMSLSTIR